MCGKGAIPMRTQIITNKDNILDYYICILELSIPIQIYIYICIVDVCIYIFIYIMLLWYFALFKSAINGFNLPSGLIVLNLDITQTYAFKTSRR